MITHVYESNCSTHKARIRRIAADHRRLGLHVGRRMRSYSRIGSELGMVNIAAAVLQKLLEIHRSSNHTPESCYG